MQESIYCDDARIAQGFDTYTVANRTGSLFDRKIGGLTGLELSLIHIYSRPIPVF